MIRSFLIIIYIGFYTSSLSAQETDCPEPKKKAVKLFQMAGKASYSDSYGLLIDAIELGKPLFFTNK